MAKILRLVFPILGCISGSVLLVLGFILPDHYRYTGEVILKSEQEYLELQNAIEDSRVLDWPKSDIAVVSLFPELVVKINVYTSLGYDFPYGEQDTIPVIGNFEKALIFMGLGTLLFGGGFGLLLNKSYREWTTD